MELFELVSKGTPQEVQSAINQGVDVNTREEPEGWTPLMFAAMANPNAEVIATLRKAGADLNARDRFGWTPLIYAAKFNQNLEVILVLVEKGADVNAQSQSGMTPLMLAARHNPNPKVITTLLEVGADGKAKDNQGKTAFDDAQHNPKLKGRRLSAAPGSVAPGGVITSRQAKLGKGGW